MIKLNKKLKREFYTRDVLAVAKELLGTILVKKEDEKILAGKIVEVEAYEGTTDEAAHTYGGKTKRNEVMFGEGGYLYVYFTYGNHFCVNVVSGVEGKGSGVLIRGIEPVEGIETMALNRFGKTELTQKEIYNLTSGPGKICKAFNIHKQHYGINLLSDYIFIVEGEKIKYDDIVVTKRVGITRSVDLPWRFYLKNNRYVSRK